MMASCRHDLSKGRPHDHMARMHIQRCHLPLACSRSQTMIELQIESLKPLLLLVLCGATAKLC